MFRNILTKRFTLNTCINVNNSNWCHRGITIEHYYSTSKVDSDVNRVSKSRSTSQVDQKGKDNNELHQIIQMIGKERMEKKRLSKPHQEQIEIFMEVVNSEKITNYYDLSHSIIIKHPKLYNIYKNLHMGSLRDMLAFLFPRREWIPWLFKSRSPINSITLDTQVKFLHWYQKEYGVAPETFFKLNINTFAKYRMKFTSNSYVEALKIAYPDIKWHPWLFKNPPSDVDWQSDETKKQFREWMIETYHITNIAEQVPQIKSFQRHVLISTSLVYKHWGKSLLKVAQTIFPEIQWSPLQFKVLKLKKDYTKEELLILLEHRRSNKKLRFEILEELELRKQMEMKERDKEREKAASEKLSPTEAREVMERILKLKEEGSKKDPNQDIFKTPQDIAVEKFMEDLNKK